MILSITTPTASFTLLGIMDYKKLSNGKNSFASISFTAKNLSDIDIKHLLSCLGNIRIIKNLNGRPSRMKVKSITMQQIVARNGRARNEALSVKFEGKSFS